MGLVRRIETPFFGQSLYMVGPKAKDIVGDRIARLIAHRTGSPRFLQHALCVTNVRIALISQGTTTWRFEQQVSSSFRFGTTEYQVRPDGVTLGDRGMTVVEVDLGHIAPAKFANKLKAYDMFIASGECSRLWNVCSFVVLTITTDKLRASRLKRLLPKKCAFSLICQTLDEFGVPHIGSWS
jgi:hypothetical protein